MICYLLKKFHPRDNLKDIEKIDIIILCLPTPLNKSKKPDLTFIQNTLKSILKYLRKGQLLILESSTHPGSTRELIDPIIKDRKFIIGKDFFVGYSPEREDPNNRKKSITLKIFRNYAAVIQNFAAVPSN